MRIETSWLGEWVELPPPSPLVDALVAAGVEVEHVEPSVADDSAQQMHLSVTPNRADLLCHLGLAREIAAASGRRLLPTPTRLLEQGPRVQTLCRLQVDEVELTRAYVGRVVRHVKVGPSPRWLQQRLLAVGQRPVNNVVDVSNYVMLDVGVPLHTFDLGTIAHEHGIASVQVRRARADESITTLDGQPRVLHSSDLIVADAQGPLALAGVLGGQRSQITEASVEVLIEAAAFAPAGVQQSAKRHGLRTEASLRFGRGVDPSMAMRAAERAAALLAECAGGEVATGALQVQQKGEHHKEILLRLAFVQRWLGVHLSAEAIVALLEPLHIRCTRRTQDALVLMPPSFRPDLEREADLVEEVARRHGLERIVPRLPARIDPVGAPAPAARKGAQQRVGEPARRALLREGVSECVHFAFASPAMLAPFLPEGAAAPIPLLNPLGEEQSCLRTHLLPALLASLERNMRRGQTGFAGFELGTVFMAPATAREAVATPSAPAAGDLSAARAFAQAQQHACDAVLPQEHRHLAVVLAGQRAPGSLWHKQAQWQGPDLVGVFEAVVAAYDLASPLQLRADAAALAPLNPYASVAVYTSAPDAEPECLGYFGQLEPALAQQRTGSLAPVYVLELFLDRLEALPRRRVLAKAPPKYPSTRRDVAVIAPADLPAEQVRAFLQRHAAEGLPHGASVQVGIFDVYAGAHVPDGHVSLAFCLLYQSEASTLTDETVTPAFFALLQKARDALGVAVRDGSAPPG